MEHKPLFSIATNIFFPPILIPKGAESEQRIFMGENETTGDDEKTSEMIVIESLSNIQTVASLSLEARCSEQYANALYQENPRTLRKYFMKGLLSGVGPLCQEWSFALLFWFGIWLINEHPNLYTNRGFAISVFSLLFALSGMSAAQQSGTNRSAALSAAKRTFDLMERQSQIDPLSTEGKKSV